MKDKDKGEIILIPYRKELVDKNLTKRKRGMKTLRILFIALMIAGLQGAVIAAYYLYDPIFNHIDLSIGKYIWFGFLMLSSIALIALSLWLFMKNNPNKILETKSEHLFYDNEKLLYSYVNKKDNRGVRTEIEIPWNKISNAKYYEGIMGFILNGDFIKRKDKKEEHVKSVIIYDYMWDLKIIMFKHGITAKGNIV